MTHQKLYELKHKRMEKLREAEGLLAQKNFEGHGGIMAEVAKMNAEIDALELQLAEEGRFADGDEHMKGLHMQQQQAKEEEAQQQGLDEIRGSNDYAKSFAKAMARGVTVSAAQNFEEYAPLMKALTEGGGAPSGAEGGFLVPLDFDNRILKMQKDYFDLSSLFNVEMVSTLSGWRVVEDGLPKPMPSVAEMANIPKDDQPKFRQINYAVKKYSDRIAISGELMEDNAAGLLNYVLDWFGPKLILTKNALLLKLLQSITDPLTLVVGKEDEMLRRSLITYLNTAHSRQATLLTNQEGYAEMDSWADTTGRPLLVPNPADPQVQRYRGREVAYADDDLLADEAGGTPLYVGNFKALGTLFVRKGLELATTNIGGEAWATGSHEVRAICRMDAQLLDAKAAYKLLIPTT